MGGFSRVQMGGVGVAMVCRYGGMGGFMEWVDGWFGCMGGFANVDNVFGSIYCLQGGSI